MLTDQRQPPVHTRTDEPRVGIVVSRYNHTITSTMLDAAIAEAVGRGVSRDRIEIYDAPGAYELPMLADRLAMSERVDGVLALGCIIRGQTQHDRHIADAIAQGIMYSQLQTGVPIAFGVLTVLDAQQAQDRAGGSNGIRGNKGAESMAALLDTIATMRAIDAGEQVSTVQSRHDKTKDTSRVD